MSTYLGLCEHVYILRIRFILRKRKMLKLLTNIITMKKNSSIKFSSRKNYPLNIRDEIHFQVRL